MGIRTMKNSAIAVPVKLSAESVEITWNALKTAKKPRLQCSACHHKWKQH